MIHIRKETIKGSVHHHSISHNIKPETLSSVFKGSLQFFPDVHTYYIFGSYSTKGKQEGEEGEKRGGVGTPNTKTAYLFSIFDLFFIPVHFHFFDRVPPHQKLWVRLVNTPSVIAHTPHLGK